MFPAGPATEILTGDENLGVAVLGLVQHEIGVFIALAVKAHFIEQVHTQSRTLDRFEELLGDDHVGVDVDQGHRGSDAGEGGEFLHVSGLRPGIGDVNGI